MKNNYRILCEYSEGGSSYVRAGWGRAFTACGHQFAFWVPSQKSILDAMNEFRPDIFLGTTYGVDRALHKAIAARPDLRVGLFASAWGDLVDHLDRQRYPLVFVTDDEKRTIEHLRNETGRPHFVFVHVTERYREGVIGGWRNIGVEPVGILNAADTFVYYPGESRPEFSCDACMVGGYWPYKARNLDDFVLPLSRRYDLKVFGSSSWPLPEYLGRISQDDERDLYASAKVCLSVSEPHSTDLGFDIIERPFKVLACGRPLLSDRVDELALTFGEQVTMARTPTEYQERLDWLLADESARHERSCQARELARNHTYFDRVAQMFVHWGMPEDAAAVLAVKTRHLA